LSLDFQSAEYEAEKILSEVLENKVLLLLAENLNLIFDSIGKEGQEKLRALIQNTGQITIIAASQSLFTAVSLRTCPFYGFFNIEHLERLSFEDAVELLINIAKYENKEDLVALLQTEKGRVRVRALHHLAGGSPRIYVIFSQFIQADSLDEFTSPMLKMLDELTPYYQAKMLELSAQQRKLITFLCRARGAVTVQEIARQNHISQQTASGQLKKLKMSGFVESQKSGKESYYEIAEPLMRLVFSIKENRGTPVSIVIELIRHWFSLDELKQFKGDKSLKAFGKNFIDASIIQKAMDIKEPSPHLSSSMAEFNRYVSQDDTDNAKHVLGDLLTFSIDLTDKVQTSLSSYFMSELKKIHGKNVKKRIDLTLKFIASTPENYHGFLKGAVICFSRFNTLLIEQELIRLARGVIDKTNSNDRSALLGAVIALIATKTVNPDIADKLFKDWNLSNGFPFAIAYSHLKKSKTDNVKYIEQLIALAEPTEFVANASKNDYSSDMVLFEDMQNQKPLQEDVLLTLAVQFVKDNKKQTFNALIDTTLENVKNASIYQSIQSLKAYSESGDKKRLMDLPKEVRSLILDNQSEHSND
jgi:DNA-binding transcriptional ArsR family regulator